MSPGSRPVLCLAHVSRGGDKLAAALDHFELDVARRVCADLGSHVGGFVDCLLQRGAARVYSVDTCYGTLAWRLRRDPRVVVLERTNAMHVSLPEPVDLITIDVGWTPQAKILPNAAGLLGTTSPRAIGTPGATGGLPAGDSAHSLTTSAERQTADRTRPVVTLIKPHYEAQRHVGSAVRTAAVRTDDPATPNGSAPPGLHLVDGVLPDDQVDKVVEHVLHEIKAIGWTVVGTFPSPIRGHGGNREVFALLTLT
jgi:predicted rRNA methylase YqxC with S4 and FtsJ domains